MEQGRPAFTVDLLERYAAKGRGVISCMAAGNDVIMLGTSKGWVTRYDFGVGDSIGMILHLITSMRSNLITFFFHNHENVFLHRLCSCLQLSFCLKENVG